MILKVKAMKDTAYEFTTRGRTVTVNQPEQQSDTSQLSGMVQ